MTAIQLRAELFRQMNPLLDNEVAMTKVLEFVKGLMPSNSRNVSARRGWAAAAKKAHKDGQDALIADDVFDDETMEDWKW
jgi:antitoxin MazE